MCWVQKGKLSLGSPDDLGNYIRFYFSIKKALKSQKSKRDVMTEAEQYEANPSQKLIFIFFPLITVKGCFSGSLLLMGCLQSGGRGSMNDSCFEGAFDCIWSQSIAFVIHLPSSIKIFSFFCKFTFITFQMQTKTSLSQSVKSALFSHPFQQTQCKSLYYHQLIGPPSLPASLSIDSQNQGRLE